MEVIEDYTTLRERLRPIGRPAVIGVEGFTGSGKTRLSDDLARDIGGSTIHTDEYVTGEDESLPYPDRLDYSRLRSDITQANADASLIIIEGICLREVLRRLDITANLFLYLKRISEQGLWHDDFNLEDYEGEGAIVENREEPHRSDFAYHSSIRPHEHSDIVFHRTETADEA